MNPPSPIRLCGPATIETEHADTGPTRRATGLVRCASRGPDVAKGTWAQHPPARGKVYLVGAGPGDPELLTLKAARVLREAQVVLYDRLVSTQILAMANPAAARMPVGKRAGRHLLAQADINALMLRLAGEAKCVVRLKGGNPFTFGRGGEEAEALAAAGIPFEVVPGITAAAGCAAAANIPLTHRDHAQACVLVTGSRQGEHLELDWRALARADQTLVFHMGVGNAERIAFELIRHGLDAATPVAIVCDGTTARQRVFTGCLQGLARMVEAQRVRPPALIVVGKVVALRERLTAQHASWISGLAHASL